MGSHQIPIAWSERGYVPPDQLDIRDDDDEKGEAAYMKCFHESSKIGRVPNASYFVNSPTARAYVEKRDKELFPVKALSGTPIPNPDLPSWCNRKEASKVRYPSISESTVLSSNVPLPQLLKTTNILSSQDIQLQPQQISSADPHAIDQLQIPWSMEPQTSARGPPRMIR